MIAKIKELIIKYKEIIMYLIFGVLSTVVSWGTYALFTKLIPSFSISSFEITTVMTSNVLSWVCAVIFAYITNKLFVFNSKSWAPQTALKEFALFISSRLITGVLEWVGVPLLVSLGLGQTIFGIEGMLSKVLVSIIVVILNYVFSKLLIFKNGKNGKEEGAKTA